LGGGRVIHECCHFFDLFNFLLGQTNPRIVADSAGVSGSNSVARDNISVSLRYPNGSLANLVYVAMGGRSMDRERLEIHGQRSSFVLDDFINLEFFGASKQSWRLPRQDKGHHAELEQVANKIRGKPTSLISTEEVFNATELTFRVDEAIRGSSPF
jgi:polar amino acid transport system substrate-binding protein